MAYLCTALFFCCALIPAACRADELVFGNAERLVGRLLSMGQGRIVFKSDTLGEITIDAAKVTSLTTDDEVTVCLKDGSELRGRALRGAADRVISISTGRLPARVLAFADIASIGEVPRPRVLWSGNVAAGFTGTNGNSFGERYNLDVSIMRRSDRHRLQLSALYLAGREERDDEDEHKEKVTVEENFTIKGKYDYFFTKKQYGYVSGSFKKDHIADLDHRVITSAGAGYQLIDTDRMRLSSDLGLAYLYEKFSTRREDADAKGEAAESSAEAADQGEGNSRVATVRDVTHNRELALQVGSNFEWQINNTVKALFNLSYNPSINDFSDYYLSSDAEIRLALTRGMYSSLKAILDYDSQPGEAVGSTDTKYIFGFGWGF